MILQYVFNTGIQYFVWVLQHTLQYTVGILCGIFTSEKEICTKKNSHHLFRPVVPWCAHLITTGTPGFSDLTTALDMGEGGVKNLEQLVMSFMDGP